MQPDEIDILPAIPFARRVAARVHQECGGFHRLDELESEAMVGLLKARNSYDPARGSWMPFAVNKVRTFSIGSVLPAFSAVRRPERSRRGSARRCSFIQSMRLRTKEWRLLT